MDVSCLCDRAAITDVIGAVEFNFFHRWSDFIFVVSAVLTIVAFMITRKSRPGLQSSGTDGLDGDSTVMIYSGSNSGVSITVNTAGSNKPPSYNTTNYDRFRAYVSGSTHPKGAKGV